MLVFSSLKSLIPKVNGIATDNWIFRLHSNVTIIFLAGFTILATSREYIGTPISCTHNSQFPPNSMITQFCWIQSTFSVPNYWDGEEGHDVIYPGIGPRKTKDDPEVYHKYYQWITFTLCLQVILFYIPRYLWKVWEGGKTEMLLQGLNNPMSEKKENLKKLEMLMSYLVENRGRHNWYAYKYAWCEILNLLNVVLQTFLIDKFLGGEFRTFGLEVFSFIREDDPLRVDPMVKVFPRMTKCKFYSYGLTGDVENKDALCLLPLNVINEKIYIFMWLWFCILTALSSVAVLYRVVVFVFPKFRVVPLHMRCSGVRLNQTAALVSKMAVGDWFVLYQLSKNMDSMLFRDLMQMLNVKFEEELKGQASNESTFTVCFGMIDCMVKG